MESIIAETRERMQKSFEAFETHIGTVRTGRANPAVLNRIMIEYYGAEVPLPQVASISSPDPRTILVSPFDKSVTQDIVKAIMESDLGFNPNDQGDAVFISVPQLNDERRRALVRQVHNMAEEARVAVRNVRRDSNDELKLNEKEGLLSEDELRRGEAEVQKVTDEFVRLIDDRAKNKEADILVV